MIEHYVTHSEDVRKCPKTTCKGYGFIPEGYCSKELQCIKCKTTWRDPANYHPLYTFTQEIKGLLRFNSAHFTHFRNLIFEEPCPRCGVMISKNGGCEHMMCGRCKHEFCWFCLGPYYGYLHSNTLQFCPYRYFAVVGVMFGLILIAGTKIGYQWEAAGSIIFPLYYYAIAGLLIDIHGLIVIAIIMEYLSRDFKYHLDEYRRLKKY
jgi:hypothetical protein